MKCSPATPAGLVYAQPRRVVSHYYTNSEARFQNNCSFDQRIEKIVNSVLARSSAAGSPLTADPKENKRDSLNHVPDQKHTAAKQCIRYDTSSQHKSKNYRRLNTTTQDRQTSDHSCKYVPPTFV